MKLNKFMLYAFIFLVGSVAVSAQSNDTNATITGGGGSVANSTSLAGSNSPPLIAGGKTYKNLFFSEPVKSLEFEISKNVWTGRPFPEKVKYLPKSVSYLDNIRNVYTYFKIKSDKINQSNLVFAKIKFNVKNSWLEKNNLTKNDIELFVYDDNGWTAEGIKTEYFGENSEDMFYVSEVPYFSYFAITEKKKETPVVIEPADDIEEVIEIAEAVVIKEKPNNFGSMTFAAMALILIAIVVVYLSRKKK